MTFDDLTLYGRDEEEEFGDSGAYSESLEEDFEEEEEEEEEPGMAEPKPWNPSPRRRPHLLLLPDPHRPLAAEAVAQPRRKRQKRNPLPKRRQRNRQKRKRRRKRRNQPRKRPRRPPRSQQRKKARSAVKSYRNRERLRLRGCWVLEPRPP